MGNLSETSLESPEAVELALPWGPVVRGLRWGSGADRALFLHEPGADIDAWAQLPRIVANRLPLEVVAIDLPGHGLSDDPWEPHRFPDLLRRVLDGSSRRHFVVAAESTATAAVACAGGLTLAGVVGFSPDALTEEMLSRSARVPKLFFAGSLAADDVLTARSLATVAGGWAVVTSLPVTLRGTALLAPPWDTQIAGHVAAFFQDCLRAP